MHSSSRHGMWVRGVFTPRTQHLSSGPRRSADLAGNYSNASWSVATNAGSSRSLTQFFGRIVEFNDTVVPTLAAVHDARTMGL